MKAPRFQRSGSRSRAPAKVGPPGPWRRASAPARTGECDCRGKGAAAGARLAARAVKALAPRFRKTILLRSPAPLQAIACRCRAFPPARYG